MTTLGSAERKEFDSLSAISEEIGGVDGTAGRVGVLSNRFPVL